MMRSRGFIVLASSLFVASWAHSAVAGDTPRVGERLARRGDEIMVCGQLYHTTAPVVLWTDPGGYDAYRLERRFAPPDQANKPSRKNQGKPLETCFGMRRGGLSQKEIERVRGGGWDLPLLQKVVDQFVIHYDVCGTSQRCFRVLHDERGLSVHFMLDLDGTIYQTLDLKEQAWHATIANGRSIGIEIANMGGYPVSGPNPLDRWYRKGPEGRTAIVFANPQDRSSLHDPQALLAPARDQPIVGTVQGQLLRQYDLTERQYDSLIRLTATLCTVFPKIRCDYPRDESGAPRTAKLPAAEYREYHGILGHYHVQSNKVDPGPAFQWDRLVAGARGLMTKRQD
ncbi:MAG: N-acetylmuramoyl-L-alanine amidase [Isosphaeraceae bacterium]